MGARFWAMAGPGWAGQKGNLMKSGYERGKENGCLAWPGLAEAGLSGERKMDSKEMGIHFLSPVRDIFSFPGEGKMESYERCCLFIPLRTFLRSGSSKHLETIRFSNGN